jgi:hypothetical protein
MSVNLLLAARSGEFGNTAAPLAEAARTVLSDCGCRAAN